MKLLFISLGCDKNLVDSEVMLGELSKRGYSFTEEYGGFRTVIYRGDNKQAV